MSRQINVTPDPKAMEAFETWKRRQSRSEHPRGRFDNGGRWYPSDEEWQPCCRGVRSPSRAYPYSYLTHCRSIEHVASLYGVDPAALRRLAAQERTAPREAWKLVAQTEDGRLLSIYNGQTEYRLGEELRQPARQSHGGGYYVYATPDEARRAALPRDSALLDAPRVLLRVRVGGSYCRYGNGKLAYSRIVPLEVVPIA